MSKVWKPVAWEDIEPGDYVRSTPGYGIYLIEHIGSQYFMSKMGDLIGRRDRLFDRFEDAEETPQGCPFCGMRRDIEKIRVGYQWQVKCSFCEAAGPFDISLRQAISAWNRILVQPEEDK